MHKHTNVQTCKHACIHAQMPNTHIYIYMMHVCYVYKYIYKCIHNMYIYIYIICT